MEGARFRSPERRARGGRRPAADLSQQSGGPGHRADRAADQLRRDIHLREHFAPEEIGARPRAGGGGGMRGLHPSVVTAARSFYAIGLPAPGAIARKRDILMPSRPDERLVIVVADIVRCSTT